MKIAIPVDSNIDEVKVNDSFGRAPYYLIHDTETKEDLFVFNTAARSAGGAGIRAAQLVVDQKPDVFLAPRMGQNAADVIKTANIAIYKTEGSSVKRNIERYLAGELSPLDDIHAGLHSH